MYFALIFSMIVFKMLTNVDCIVILGWCIYKLVQHYFFVIVYKKILSVTPKSSHLPFILMIQVQHSCISSSRYSSYGLSSWILGFVSWILDTIAWEYVLLVIWGGICLKCNHFEIAQAIPSFFLIFMQGSSVLVYLVVMLISLG